MVDNLVERLRKCALMMREERPDQANAASQHREQCIEPTHYGCNIYQSILAMEAAEARIKALEQAIDHFSRRLRFACFDGHRAVENIADEMATLASAQAGQQETNVRVIHGQTCNKKDHLGGGYLHASDNDGPYDVDHVEYCGRCHQAL